MSHKKASSQSFARRLRSTAPVFAALGDQTRLSLLHRLCDRAPCSIVSLSKGSRITRQGVTRHLRVLEKAGLVRSEMLGRVRVFELLPGPLAEATDYLASVSRQWDVALVRLKRLVENKH